RTRRPGGMLVLRVLLEPRLSDRGEGRPPGDRAPASASDGTTRDPRRLVRVPGGARPAGEGRARPLPRRRRPKPDGVRRRHRPGVLGRRHAAIGPALRAPDEPSEPRPRGTLSDGAPLPRRDRVLRRTDRLLPWVLVDAMPGRHVPRYAGRRPAVRLRGPPDRGSLELLPVHG